MLHSIDKDQCVKEYTFESPLMDKLGVRLERNTNKSSNNEKANAYGKLMDENTTLLS